MLHLVTERLRWTGLQYRDPVTGRYISRTAVRRALEESLGNLTRLTDTLADDLRAGRLSVDAWQAEMKLIIRQTQMAAAEIANGGRAQMTQADYGRVGQQVRVQYAFLDNWVAEIRAGAPVDNRIEGRARQYIRSARTSFLTQEAAVMSQQGFLARNVTRASESCAECLAEQAKGLVPVEQLSMPGTRVCRGNCKCFLVFERAA